MIIKTGTGGVVNTDGWCRLYVLRTPGQTGQVELRLKYAAGAEVVLASEDVTGEIETEIARKFMSKLCDLLVRVEDNRITYLTLHDTMPA